MIENNRLKPCPFCGNSAASFRSSYNSLKEIYLVFVKCEVCHARTGYSYTNENPALNSYTSPAALRSQTFWNSRPFERADPDPDPNPGSIDDDQHDGDQAATDEAPNEE